jgi:hypothetical protein
MRGIGLPCLGSSVTVFKTNAPKSPGFKKAKAEGSWPNVPEAVKSGLDNSREPMRVFSIALV